MPIPNLSGILKSLAFFGEIRKVSVKSVFRIEGQPATQIFS